MKGLFSWMTTPPQAYAVYAVVVVLVAVLSFAAGTLKPKIPPGMAPPSASQTSR